MNREGFPISKISVLSDEYQEIVHSQTKTTKAQYNELSLVERVIDGQKYYNLYMIEPNRIYKCDLTLPSDESYEKDISIEIKTELNALGIFLLKSFDSVLYIAHYGINTIYIEKGSSITMIKGD